MTQKRSTHRQRGAAAATITVVGGSLFVNGVPAQAAPFEVTNTNDSGAGSLAQAIVDANAANDADEITFAPGLTGSIDFAATSRIKYDLSIVGPGDGSITIASAGADALYLYNGASLTVSGLTFDGGSDRVIRVNNGGDIELSDLETSATIISGSNVGVVSIDGIVSSFNPYVSNQVANLNTLESLAVSNVTGERGSPYFGSVGFRFYTVGTGDAASADVVLADVSGTLDGVYLRMSDVAGDVTVSDATVSGRIRVIGAGDVTFAGVEGIVDTYSSLRSRGADRVFVDDLDMAESRGMSVRVGRVGSYAGDVDVDRVSVSNVVGARVGMYQIEGRVDINNVSADGNYSSVYVRSAGGDVTVSNVDLLSPFARFSVDAVTPSIADGDPLPDLPTVLISDVQIGGEGSAARFSLSDFGEVRIDGQSETVDGPAFGSVVDSTIFGSLSVRSSTVTMSDVSVIGRGDGAGGGYGGPLFRAEPAPVDDDFIGDGSTPISVTRGSLTATQISVAGHKAESALFLYGADATFEHSTFSDLELSVATVIAAEPYFDVVVPEPSTLHLDHTILAEAGPDGEFVSDEDRRRRIMSLTSSPLLTVTADYSLVGEGVIDSESLAATNVETADARVGEIIAIPGRRPSAAPLADSPAVNGGDPAIADAPVTDQRGNARVRGVIDIGAVEVGSLLESIAPARFVDTRATGETIDGDYEAAGKRTAGSIYTVQIAGRDQVPADATSVIMNVTSIQPDTNGYVTVFSCDDDQPTASSLNYTVGSNLGNEIVAGLADDGTVCVFTSGSTHLTIDVVAYGTADSAIQPITPARAFETRLGKTTADGRFGGSGQMPAGSQQTVVMGGRFGIPDDATAVIVNVTAINPSANGFATVHPCLATPPTASSLNFTAGVNRGNEIIAPLNSAGELCIYTSAATDFAIDVVGYLPDGSINPVTPSRLLETRDGQSTADGQSAGGGPVGAASSTTVQITGRVGVPEGATAVVVNLTAINPSTRGYATIHPCLTTPPSAASLNYEAGVSGGNEVVAGLNADGELCIFSSASTHLAIDIVAYII